MLPNNCGDTIKQKLLHEGERAHKAEILHEHQLIQITILFACKVPIFRLFILGKFSFSGNRSTFHQPIIPRENLL